MIGTQLPASQSGPGQPEQGRGRDEIAAAKRRLGELFRAWRIRAGLTQEELALRTGYKRPSVRNAENGTSRSRPLFEAADRATGAGGVLLAERDRVDAVIRGARQDAARRARAAVAQQARPAPGLSTAEPDAVALVILRCPHCGTSLPTTVGIHVTTGGPVVDTDFPQP